MIGMEFDPPEITARAYLLGVQPDPVHVTAPKPLPTGRFVQVIGVGGNARGVVQRVMVTFICWGTSRADAAVYAEKIRALAMGCRELGGMPVSRRREIGSPTYRGDESGRDTYQFTVEYQVRGRSSGV